MVVCDCLRLLCCYGCVVVLLCCCGCGWCYDCFFMCRGYVIVIFMIVCGYEFMITN